VGAEPGDPRAGGVVPAAIEHVGDVERQVEPDHVLVEVEGERQSVRDDR
jgi:hypothetical protein